MFSGSPVAVAPVISANCFWRLDGITPERLKHLEHHVRDGFRGLEVPGLRCAGNGGKGLEKFEESLPDFLGFGPFTGSPLAEGAAP